MNFKVLLSTVLTVVLVSIVASCSSAQKNHETDKQAMARQPSASDREPDLSGSLLGEAHYITNQKGPQTPAIRLYLEKVEGELGNYYAVIFQYPNVPGILPKYLFSQTVRKLNKVFGYLKHIGDKISAYKMTPRSEPRTFELRPLKVVDTAVEANMNATPLVLTLASGPDFDHKNPLAGARIATGNGDGDITFPKKGDVTDLQYKLTALSYKAAKLDSTWHKKLITDDFLAAYWKADDVALQFRSSGGQNTATFIDNQAKFNISKEKRIAVFTNPKSAFLSGTYQVATAAPGMFVLTPTERGLPGAEHVVGRIAMFLDVFDATQSLGQAVVEVAFVNPEDPTDFLMYYQVDPQQLQGKPKSLFGK